MADAAQQCDFDADVPPASEPAQVPAPSPGVAVQTDATAATAAAAAPSAADAGTAAEAVADEAVAAEVVTEEEKAEAAVADEAVAAEEAVSAEAVAEYRPEDDPSITEIHTMDGALYRRLTAMGFSDVAVKKSIVCGCIDEGTCVQWLEMHLGVPELEDPLEPGVYVAVRDRRELSEAERAAKVAELKAKIAAKKATEGAVEQRRGAAEERSRVRSGKDAQQSQEARAKRERELAYAERQREKEEDRVAKARVVLELAVDRYVRQGLDAEEARRRAVSDRDEKAAAARADRERRLLAEQSAAESRPPAAATAGAAPSAAADGAAEWDLGRIVAAAPPGAEAPGAPAATDFDRDVELPPPTAAGFRALLAASEAALLAGAPAAAAADRAAVLAPLRAAKETLRTVLANIAERPLDARVRTVKTTSGTFVRRLLPVPRACAFLRLVGFQEAPSSLHFTLHFLLLARIAAALEALA